MRLLVLLAMAVMPLHHSRPLAVFDHGRQLVSTRNPDVGDGPICMNVFIYQTSRGPKHLHVGSSVPPTLAVWDGCDRKLFNTTNHRLVVLTVPTHRKEVNR